MDTNEKIIKVYLSKSFTTGKYFSTFSKYTELAPLSVNKEMIGISIPIPIISNMAPIKTKNVRINDFFLSFESSTNNNLLSAFLICVQVKFKY